MDISLTIVLLVSLKHGENVFGLSVDSILYYLQCLSYSTIVSNLIKIQCNLFTFI